MKRSGGTYPKCDVQHDHKVNVQDVQACTNHILGLQDWGGAADANNDETIDVRDVQEIVNTILGSE